MDIEFGIRNVGRPVSFSTDAQASEVSASIEEALKSGQAIDIVDDKNRHIIVPAGALGYAIVGSDTTRPVGFGAL
ncbi:ATP-binding protein [Bombiscardovia nodaiensis]|uniref:ATP-binding protein n=1 Tax=Bombiscardovia nodaiensis TaxID=2932181 RepID=A0ABM8B8U1_9BIFI|nr:ATP-binding protein [Bombiscardovia nodaiensis]